MTEKKGHWLVRGPTTGEITSLLAVVLGACIGFAAGVMECGGAGVALPCASARRSRLLLVFFLTTALVLSASSLLVKGPSSGK